MSLLKKHRALTEESDESLIKKYVATSDLEVLGALYQRYMYLVYGVCLKYYKNRDNSQDAVMQIFEKLVTEIPKHEIANFKSWLYVVTKHYCMRQLQNQTSLSKKNKEFYEEQFMESTLDLSPIDKPEEIDLNSALQECIKQLKKEQKACIELFYLQEKCYQEVSNELSIPMNKVKSYIQNGKRNLKLCLESKHE